MVEQLIRNEQVGGSIPFTSSKRNPVFSRLAGFLRFLTTYGITVFGVHVVSKLDFFDILIKKAGSFIIKGYPRLCVVWLLSHRLFAAVCGSFLILLWASNSASAVVISPYSILLK